MSSAVDIILNIVCPLLGTITAYQMFCAPLPDVQKAISRGTMNDLNPLPWAFLMGNCLGWTLYSVLTQNIWLLVANAPGFLIAVWFNLAASKLKYQMQFQVLPQIANNDTAQLDPSKVGDEEGSEPETQQQEQQQGQQQQDQDQQRQSYAPPTQHLQKFESDEITGNMSETSLRQSSSSDDASQILEPGDTVHYKVPTHDYWVMGITIGWVAILAILGFAQSWSTDTKQSIVGIITNFNLLFFYGAPLSTIAVILQTRNTASIHVPTMTMNTINSCFWTAYGFAIFDFFVFVPNGIGACLGFVQVFLYFTFPRKIDETPNTIAATIIVGDAMADAVVMGDPDSEDAVIMINKEDVRRLQHSVAVDEKLGGIQVVTTGVPVFDDVVEPELMREEQEERHKEHRRCVTFGGIPSLYGAVPGEDEDTAINGNATTNYGGLPGGGGGNVSRRHIRNHSASEVPLINLSRHRRKASNADVPLDLLDQNVFASPDMTVPNSNEIAEIVANMSNQDNSTNDVENPLPPPAL